LSNCCSKTLTPAELEQLLLGNADARGDYSQHCEFDAELRLFSRSSGILEAALDQVRDASEAKSEREEERSANSYQLTAPSARPRRFTMGQPDDAGVICFALTLLLTLFMAKKD